MRRGAVLNHFCRFDSSCTAAAVKFVESRFVIRYYFPV
jgi:hypothetical protein